MDLRETVGWAHGLGNNDAHDDDYVYLTNLLKWRGLRSLMHHLVVRPNKLKKNRENNCSKLFVTENKEDFFNTVISYRRGLSLEHKQTRILSLWTNNNEWSRTYSVWRWSRCLFIKVFRKGKLYMHTVCRIDFVSRKKSSVRWLYMGTVYGKFSKFSNYFKSSFGADLIFQNYEKL